MRICMEMSKQAGYFPFKSGPEKIPSKGIFEGCKTQTSDHMGSGTVVNGEIKVSEQIKDNLE
jgi:hypothetical protein